MYQKEGLHMPSLKTLTWLLMAALVVSAAGFAPSAGSDPPATWSTTAAPAAWVGDLTPISPSEWNYDRAAHLLERAGFGGTPEEIRALAAMTPEQAVRHLVRYQEVPEADI